MAEYTDSSRLLKLHTPLGADKLLVLGFSGEERISGLFEYTIDLIAPRSEFPDAAKLVGKGATLSINPGRRDAFEAEGKRVVHGEIIAFEETGQLHPKGAAAGFDYLRFRAVLAPWFWNLTHAADCRIFQQKSVPQIIEQVLKERGVSDYRLALTGSHAPREYCVQYRETDFAFLSRLMEEEGIFYFFEHKDGEHKIVLADSKSAHQGCGPAAGTAFRPQRQAGQASVRTWIERRAVTTAKYAVQSYNFETPATSLLATSETTVTVGKNTSLEVYDFPQNYATKNAGDAQAKLRMEAIEAQHHGCEGTSDCAWLVAGSTFKLTGHYRSDQNAEYLVTRVRHEARNSGYEQLVDGWEASYANSFSCVPKPVPFRAPAATPRPRIHGVQTAVVVGPKGEEIYTDKYGRIKVQFHWDRAGKSDENGSCWIRVAQSVASNQWGAQFIPRIGQEVLVDFVEGDPDRPLITGALYNAQKMPPYALPANATQSGVKTRSSKQGTAENFNELRFEDKKGEEDVYFHAEKNFHRVVENNDDLTVGLEKKDKGNQTIVIHNDRTATLKEGNEKLTVEKGHRETVVSKGNDTHKVEQGNREVTVGQGNDALTVSKGNRTVVVDTGNDSLKVAKGNRTVEISMGNDTLDIKMGNQTTKIDLGKSSTEAMQGIELKVGQSSVVINQQGVTIKGMMVTVEGQVQTAVKGAMVQVQGSAMTQVKGGVTMIG